jgi:hypothetical protein
VTIQVLEGLSAGGKIETRPKHLINSCKGAKKGMRGTPNRPVKLWGIMVAAVVVWVLSTGFQRANSANKEDL